MSLAEVVSRDAFELTTDPVALARAHSNFGRLTGKQIEKELYRALDRKDAACAAEVIGPTGAGKSSCIMRVVSDIASRGTSPHEVLIVSAGDAESTLDDSAEFALYLVELIRNRGFRFSNEVQDELASMAPDETVVSDAVLTHTFSAEGGVTVARAGYQRALEDAHEERKFGRSPAHARGDLEAILKVMRDNEVRPVVVIDDTDRFVDQRTGAVRDTVDALFANGVRLLAELRVDFVVAVHPRFAGTSGYDAAAAKHVRTHLRVPFLLIEDGRNPLAEILAHHLRAHDVRSPIEELITVEALNVLYGAYKDQDLRNVLEIARQAARIACDAGAQRVAEDHVSRAIAALARSS